LNIELSQVQAVAQCVVQEYERVVMRLNDVQSYMDFVLNDVDSSVKNISQEVRKLQQPKPSYASLKSHTVYIRGQSRSERWLGTGFVLAMSDTGTLVMTNAHVVGKGLTRPQIVVENGDTFVSASVLATHQTEDIVILYIDRPLVDKTAVPGFALAAPQAPVYIVGHHLGKKYLYGEGVWAGQSGASGIIQVPALYGNSGSAVFDSNGYVVGIVYAIEAYSKAGDVDVAHAVVVDALTIVNFLKQLKNS